MTDLSTKHLQYLLAESSPRPWIFREDTDDTVFGTQEIGHEVYAGQKCIFGVWNDPVIDEHSENLPLAALAPEITHELLVLRDALADVIGIWQYASTDPERTPIEQNLAARVVDHINEALGDHDE